MTKLQQTISQMEQLTRQKPDSTPKSGQSVTTAFDDVLLYNILQHVSACLKSQHQAM